MRSLKYLALMGLFVAVPALLPLSPSLAAQTPAATTAPAAAPAPDPTRAIPPKLDYDSLAFARQLTNWFYASEADSLFAHSAPEMQGQMTKEGWSQAMAQFVGRVGSEISVVEERWVKRNGRRQYWRVLNASDFTDEPVMLRFALLPGKLMAGVGMNPASQAPPVDP